MSDFQLSLNGLFMGTAASQRNEDLRIEKRHWTEVKLIVQVRFLQNLTCIIPPVYRK